MIGPVSQPDLSLLVADALQHGLDGIVGRVRPSTIRSLSSSRLIGPHSVDVVRPCLSGPPNLTYPPLSPLTRTSLRQLLRVVYGVPCPCTEAFIDVEGFELMLVSGTDTNERCARL
jgi:hypothetical protein